MEGAGEEGGITIQPKRTGKFCGDGGGAAFGYELLPAMLRCQMLG